MSDLQYTRLRSTWHASSRVIEHRASEAGDGRHSGSSPGRLALDNDRHTLWVVEARQRADDHRVGCEVDRIDAEERSDLHNERLLGGVRAKVAADDREQLSALRVAVGQCDR